MILCEITNRKQVEHVRTMRFVSAFI